MRYLLRTQKWVIEGHAANLFTCDVQVRVFVVVAKYCATAVWADERQAIFDGMRGSGLLSPGRLAEYFTSWWYAIKIISQSLFFSLQRSAGSTRDYTADSSSWNGIWTSRRKLERSLHGSGVYGGQDSRALTKLPPDWLNWALHMSYYRSTIFNQCRDHRRSTSRAEKYQSMAEADRVI